MRCAYKYFLRNCIVVFFHLLFYYAFYIFFPALSIKYQQYLIKNMPIVFVELIIYPVIIIIMISYISIKKISNDIKNMQNDIIELIPGDVCSKAIIILKYFRIKSKVATILGTIFYPFYVSIFYYNFIFVILGIENKKFLKKRILAPALISYFTAGFSSILTLLIFIFILIFKIKNEKKIALESAGTK